MKYNKILLFFLLLFVNVLSAVDLDIDLLLAKIRNREYEKVKSQLTSLNTNEKSSATEKQLCSELNYYNNLNKEYGVYINNPILKKQQIKPINEEINAIQLLNQGLYSLLYEYDNESEAFKKLQKALKIAQKLGNKPLCCEISKAILIYYMRLFNIEDENYSYYNEIYKNNLYDKEESDIQKLLEFYIRMEIKDNKYTLREVQNVKKISLDTKIVFYQLYAKKQLAIYYELYMRDYANAYKYYLKSLNGVNKYGSDIYFTQSVLASFAGFLVARGKYTDAIHYLKLIDNKYHGKTYSNNIVFKYSQLSNAYAGLKVFDSAFMYKEKSRTLKNEFEQSKHNSIVSNLLTKEKDAQIIYLQSKFTQNKTLYLSLIFGVFLLALYSFVRWKKEDKMRRNALLETQSVKTEYFQTVEELKKTKQLVIQDHIILKNKAKVNLDDLLYIKAEDHYLQLVTNKKNEFVREKLTEIINQLPPNFVKCHRSFIVNKNHVKKVQKAFLIMNDNSEIPISRGFKIDL